MLEKEDPKLQGFFNALLNAMNPNGKSEKTIQNLKQKIMFLCYYLASLRNKQVSDIKGALGLFMTGAGASNVGINTLANIGLSVTYETVRKKMCNMVDEHKGRIR